MAGIGFSAKSPANNKVAGFTSVVVNSGTSYTVNKDTMTHIYEGEFSKTPYAYKKSNGSEVIKGFLAKASWKYNVVNLANIQALDNMSVDSVVGINLINGGTRAFGNASSPSGVPKWKLTLDGDSDKDAFIEWQIQRAGIYTGVVAADFDNDMLFGALPSLAGSALLDETAVTRSPSGVRTFYTGGVSGATTYDLTAVGEIQNTKFSAELMCAMDSELRYVPRNVHIEYAIDVLDTTGTTLNLLDTHSDLDTYNVKFDFMGECVFTAGTGVLGAVPQVLDAGDSDKDSLVRWTGSGDVLISSFAALWALRI